MAAARPDGGRTTLERAIVQFPQSAQRFDTAE